VVVAAQADDPEARLRQADTARYAAKAAAAAGYILRLSETRKHIRWRS
jgi:hypothetical protein